MSLPNIYFHKRVWFLLSHWKNWLLDLIRWRDWGPSKSPVFFSICLYLPLAHGIFNIAFLIDFFLFFIFFHFYCIYGHLINDYCDREVDRQVGKTNILGEMSENKALGIVVLTLVAGILTSLAFLKYPFFIIICILAYFMATLYSLPPVRFKERGFLGIFVPAIAQQTLPVLMIFSAFDYIGDFGVVIFSIYVTIIGLRKIAEHLRYHYIADFESGLETYTVTHGMDKVKKLLKYSRLIEMFLLVISLSWISIKVPYGFFPLFFFLVTFGLSLTRSRTLSNKRGLFIYEFFLTIFLPLFFAALLFIQYINYVFILLFLIVWQYRRIIKVVTRVQII